MKQPSIIQSVRDLQAFIQEHKDAGKHIALVPTMGALHEGHLSLVREGLKHADICVVSIFVNPAQFGPNEDYDAYPRTLETDLEKLSATGAQAVFAPTAKEMYPEGFATNISVGGVSEGLCGAARYGHFDGVATVVTKLLLQALPDISLFGEKDYQQLQVIKRLVSDLNIPVEIKGVPIVRDENGLALSSRNAYLSEDQYKIAAKLNNILFDMAEKIGSGETIKTILCSGLQQLQEAGFDSADYLECVDAKTLVPVSSIKDRDLRLLAAVRLGKTRLIDNVPA